MAVAAALAWSLAGPSAALASHAYSGTGPGLGFNGSYHDFVNGPLSSAGVITPNAPFTNTQVGACTFCHAPHGAQSSNLLWNHTLSSSSYNWDVTSTTAGTNYPTFSDQTYGGPTAKCLSCHDGTVSESDFITYEGVTPTYTITGALSGHQLVPGGVANNMKGMHPVAMPYPYGGATSTYNTESTGANMNYAEFQKTPLSPIRLYTDVKGDGTQITLGATAGKSGIECSSCHDLHNGPDVADYDLLVGMDSGAANSTTYICAKCHIK